MLSSFDYEIAVTIYVSVKPTQVDKHSEEVRARSINNRARARTRTREERGKREATIAHSSAAVAVPRALTRVKHQQELHEQLKTVVGIAICH